MNYDESAGESAGERSGASPTGPAAAARLQGATSLYLRLHAEQPVAWWPWGEAAFVEARRRDLPLLLSVGYATCHWCHVMARESFDDPAIAALLNEHFIPVKVDREARPDVDAVYMAALQALTGTGGWPMTVALDHQQRPWWAGTYFPPHDRPGLPAFSRVLGALQRTWRERRGEVERAAAEITAALEGRLAPAPGLQLATEARELTASEMLAGCEGPLQAQLAETFDPIHGGFGDAPKFPPHAAIAYLEATPTEEHASMLTATLRAIADGGVTDQLGGALHRYAVDAAWAVPHFEVMLVDQAQMLPRYAAAARATGDPRLAWAAAAMLEALERDLLRPDGLFATGLDAEAAGVEGAYHSWTPSEVAAVLPAAEAAEAARVFAVTAVGNLEGRSVLAWAGGDAEPPAVAAWRAALLAARARRPAPHRDEPAISAYNAMMIRGLLAAADHLKAPSAARARALAERAFAALWRLAFDGEQLRRSIDTPPSHPDHRLATLADQAHGGLAALALYRVSHARIHLEAGLTLAERVHTAHARAGGGFTPLPAAQPQLLIAPRDAIDGATPPAEVVAAELLAEAAAWLGRDDLRVAAEGALRYPASIAGRVPNAAVSAMLVARKLRRPPPQVVVVGAAEDPAAEALRAIAWAHPSQPLVASVSGPDDPLTERLAWTAARPRLAGRATAYACAAGVCRLPVYEPAALLAEIDHLARSAG
jgi:uncharacterized protein YyaL (SSP411 family)